MNYLQKKKLAFMSIVNSVKGFVRNITGVFPLTLEGCVDDESIIDYTLYGQSVQNGTPTPDTPIEVESVGEYDEESGKYKIPITVRGKNLLNPNKFSGGSLVEYNGIKCFKYKDYANNFTYTDDFKKNTRYRFSIRVFSDGEAKNTGISICYTDGSTTTINIKKYDTVYSVTSSSNKTIEKITGGFNWAITRYIDLTVSQLEEGTTATEYEPYHEPITTDIYLDEPLGEGQSINYKKDGLPTIPTFKGTSIISTDTTIQPSNVEITYYSNVKE